MQTPTEINLNSYLEDSSRRLEEAYRSKDAKRICIAHAEVGEALFKVHKYEDGLTQFDNATRFAEEEDLSCMAQCLGIKAQAYQDAGHLAEAFQTIEIIYSRAKQEGEKGILSDVLLQQGQLLLESGEPLLSREKMQLALEISQTINDERRLMNAHGALGSLELTLAAHKSAEQHLRKAIGLAKKLSDSISEFGLIGNLGIALFWQGKFQEATPLFVNTLRHVQSINNPYAEAQAYYYLSRIAENDRDFQGVLQFAEPGLKVAETHNINTAFAFYEMIIKAHYHLDQPEDAYAVTRDAIAYAKSQKIVHWEITFLISLGEAYFLRGRTEDARKVYQRAWDKSKENKRENDLAFLSGRLGIVMAELGNIEGAIEQHQTAIEMAEDQGLPELKAEQLCMLALAYFDLERSAEAEYACKQAVAMYQDLKQEVEVAKAQYLLDQIRRNASLN